MRSCIPNRNPTNCDTTTTDFGRSLRCGSASTSNFPTSTLLLCWFLSPVRVKKDSNVIVGLYFSNVNDHLCIYRQELWGNTAAAAAVAAAPSLARCAVVRNFRVDVKEC